MLELKAVGLSFDGASVLDGLDLAVAANELTALLGPSGCGKTTLLRLAAGSLQPTKGRIVSSFARVAMVFQEPRLMPWASALDNAAFGLKALGVARHQRRDEAARILMRLGFEPGDLAKLPGALSGGMQQRVAIARALAVKPDLVLMDEPFAALDVGLRRDLQDLVRTEVEAQGLSVLFVTHDVPEAVRLADRIVVLSGRPARIAADLRQTPVADASAIYDAAAALLRHDNIQEALFAVRGAPKEGEPKEPVSRHAAEAIPLLSGPSQMKATQSLGTDERETQDAARPVPQLRA